MLIFWKERLVFLAVPKTGTSAYEAALKDRASIAVLDPPELKHAPIYRYNRFFRPMMERMGATDMEVLAVVREPVSWLGSWYRYRQRPFLDGKPTSTKGLTFDGFVQGYLKGDQPPFAQVGSQSKFLEPRPNGTRAHFLFQYENQQALHEFLQDRLKAPIELQQKNVSSPADLSLSAEIEAKLRRKYADDFALWDRAAVNGRVAD